MNKKDSRHVTLIGINTEGSSLRLHTANVEAYRKSKKTLDKILNENKDEYEGKMGKKYAIVFYTIKDGKFVITDFFRGCLVDPEFYVTNMLSKGKTMVIAAEEFALKEIWKSKAKKNTDFGIYNRVVEMIELFWKDMFPQGLPEHKSKKYFEEKVSK